MSYVVRNQKVLLPVGVLLLGIVAAGAMILARPKVERRLPENPGPLVRVVEARPGEVRLTVASQGTVEPRTEITLIAELAGRIVSVSPSLETGGFFEEGELLARIDPRDYDLAVVRAKAELARAEVLLSREEAEAEVARREWDSLGEGEAPPLAMRVPQIAEARAALEGARAALAQAKLDQERTHLRAPFDGRVREKLADAGQFVARGTAVARIYAVDYAEVRLPIPDDRLAQLDLPFDRPRGGGAADGPKVRLTSHVAGDRSFWEGTIDRVEGEIDPKSRMVHLVARVDDPYGRDAESIHFPLAVGLFVDAEIEGRVLNGVFVLPREALRSGGRVFVVEEGRLRFRDVDILRAAREEIVLRSGLAPGDLVCLSPLDTPVDGMKVRLAGGVPEKPAAGEAR